MGKQFPDQIKIQLAHAQRSELASQVKSATGNLVHDAKKGARHYIDRAPADEEIPASERQKLKSLNRELRLNQRILINVDQRCLHQGFRQQSESVVHHLADFYFAQQADMSCLGQSQKA